MHNWSEAKASPIMPIKLEGADGILLGTTGRLTHYELPVRQRLHRRRTDTKGREGLRSAGAEACYENAGTEIGGTCSGLRDGSRGSAGVPAPIRSQDEHCIGGAGRTASSLSDIAARPEISAPALAARLGCRALARSRCRLTRLQAANTTTSQVTSSAATATINPTRQ